MHAPEDIKLERPYFFIQMADPQIGCNTAEAGGASEADLLATALQHANRLGPAFVLMSGDMINIPAEGNDPGPHAEPQADEFLRITEKLNPAIPMYLLPGNHDVLDAPTHESLLWYRRKFGPDWYKFTCGNCLYVVLNSCILYDDRYCADDAAKQLQWLPRTLQEATAAQYTHTFICMHHSLYLEDPDEEDDYFVLPRQARSTLLELFHAHGIRAVFSGHYHRNAFAVEALGPPPRGLAPCGADMELVPTRALALALGQDPPGIRIVKVFDGHIEHDYYGLDAVPDSIILSAKQRSSTK